MFSPLAFLITTTFLTAADIAKLPESAFDTTNTFRVSGVIFRPFPRSAQVYLQDESGSIQLSTKDIDTTLKDGDVIEAWFQPTRTRIYTCAFILTDYRKIGHGKPPLPILTDIKDIYRGKHDNRLVATSGTIIDAFPDEIDPNCLVLVLASDNAALPVSIRRRAHDVTNEVSWIGAHACVTGIVSAALGGFRKFNSRGIDAISSSLGLARGEEDETDLFAAPSLPSPFRLDMQRISAETRPRSIIGTVTAVWDDNNLLLQAERLDMPVFATLYKKSKLPKLGDSIKIVGFPETDTYLITLRNCRWKQTDAITAHNPTIHRIRLHDIFQDKMGRPRFEMLYYGELVNFDGMVRSISTANHQRPTLYIESDGYTIPVNASACPSVTQRIKAGSMVNLTGVCLMDVDTIRPTAPFPSIRNVSLVLRADKDATILSEPSWWSPKRLICVILILFAALVAVFARNRLLNRIILRRSKQLAKEQIAHAEAELRTGERTRLAVELHDSLSQNLAGLACQITAAKSAIPPTATVTIRHLDTAERMLLSSRTELRRCLWDLRGDTLELSDMAEAVRKTVLPVIGNAKLTMRLNIPRSRLLDSTAHAILCIIRELSSNAVRHGQATHIRIAGEFHDDRLSFSVRDNGSGFDTINYAGLAEGHFGLEGIRERVERMDGSFEISSTAKTGTRAEVNLPIPKHNEQSAAEP